VTIRGVGTDIVATARMRGLIERHGERVFHRILARGEFGSLPESADAAPFLARRFAAKEATAKALGTGIAKGVRFCDIEIETQGNGRPALILHGATRDLARELGVSRYHVSISDEDHYAMAFAILEAV
jgi:holo-[acyl-carrier protein] synthase